MAFDESRGVVVLFGHTATRGETWEWNGNSWILRPTGGVGPRHGHAMAFDTDRCRTVLFGGNDGSGNYLNDTWEWDGTTWTRKCTGGCTRPPTRHGAGMTYDAAGHVVVLFGGYSPGLLNDTWKWDGTTWTQVTTTSPPSPRSWPAMAYDAASSRIVVYGGNLVPTTCGTNTDQTWELDLSTNPATWTNIATSTQPKSPCVILHHRAFTRRGDSGAAWHMPSACAGTHELPSSVLRLMRTGGFESLPRGGLPTTAQSDSRWGSTAAGSAARSAHPMPPRPFA